MEDGNYILEQPQTRPLRVKATKARKNKLAGLRRMNGNHFSGLSLIPLIKDWQFHLTGSDTKKTWTAYWSDSLRQQPLKKLHRQLHQSKEAAMNDLNELIYRNSMLAFQQGEKTEQQRIIKLLEADAVGEYKQVMLTPRLIARIKGEAE